MTTFQMLRSFEDFLINPTYVLPLERDLPRRSFCPPQPSSPSRRYSCSHILHFSMDQAHSSSGHELVSSTKQSIESLNTIKPYNIDFALANGYTSEEEAASPIDTSDRSSLRTLSDSTSEISVIEQPIPAVARAVQLSNRAQVVQLVSAGKVRMVSMPKISESPKSPVLARPSTISGTFDSADLIRHKREWSGSSTKSISPRESTSIGSSRPLSYVGPPLLEIDTNARQRRPSLPAIMTFSKPFNLPSPTTPARTSRQPDFLRHDPFPTTASPKSPTHASRRLMPMFINRIIKRRETTPLEDVPEFLPATTTPAKPKMIARGADEVEPTIRLPPCPVSYTAGDLTSWPLRKDSVNFSHPASRPHKRARSVMI